MRLLKPDDNCELSLIKTGNHVPEYAILSHTWGKDRPGYNRIRFCAEQADRDCLRYSWVDTCCINKADFTELSEAINSMFH
jgi:hypothetical protein